MYTTAFGKTCGLMQVQELGSLETPIALTNTPERRQGGRRPGGLHLARCQREGRRRPHDQSGGG